MAGYTEVMNEVYAMSMRNLDSGCLRVLVTVAFPERTLHARLSISRCWVLVLVFKPKTLNPIYDLLVLLALRVRSVRYALRTDHFHLAGYLEGHGDLVSGLIMGIIRVIIWLIGVSNLLTKSPGPSKYENGDARIMVSQAVKGHQVCPSNEL